MWAEAPSVDATTSHQEMLSMLGTMYAVVQMQSSALQTTESPSYLERALCRARKTQFPPTRLQLLVGSSHERSPANAFHQNVWATIFLTELFEQQ